MNVSPRDLNDIEISLKDSSVIITDDIVLILVASDKEGSNQGKGSAYTPHQEILDPPLCTR